MSDPQSMAGQALQLLEDSMGFVYPAALGAAAQLGVADHLSDGPRTADELAKATGTHAPSLHRVLRLLATRDILREDSEGRFHLAPRGALLCTDAPLSVRRAVANVITPVIWRPAGEMVRSLQEGKPVFDDVFGKPFFEHLMQDPQAGATFHAAMASISNVYEVMIAEQLDLPSKGTVVDVGGGHGGLLLRILRAHEGLRGVLFDQQQALAGHQLGELGADERWELADGDFFTQVPAGADIYVLKAVLHDWSDDQCVTILRNCRRAMAPGARILIIETAIEPSSDPNVGKTLDVLMMGMLPGKERTEADFVTLLRDAGLRLNRVIPTKTPASIIEAVEV